MTHMTATDPLATADLQERAHRHLLMHFTRNGAFGPGGTPLLVLERGEGPYVFDTDGKRYFDGLSSLFCAQIGYSFGEEMAAASAQQLTTLAFNTNWANAHPPAIDLAEASAQRAPGSPLLLLHAVAPAAALPGPLAAPLGVVGDLGGELAAEDLDVLELVAVHAEMAGSAERGDVGGIQREVRRLRQRLCASADRGYSAPRFASAAFFPTVCSGSKIVRPWHIRPRLWRLSQLTTSLRWRVCGRERISLTSNELECSRTRREPKPFAASCVGAADLAKKHPHATPSWLLIVC